MKAIAILQDHPRRCGENYAPVEYACEQPGSPPQVRGKPELFDGMTAGERITPAGAGKTDVEIPPDTVM